MLLNVPTDFTSTITYQNSNYSFPHESVLSLNTDKLTSLFFSDDYILPDYISYHDQNINKQTIINKLKSNSDFNILGVSFMKFKGLEEKWEELVKTAIEWKSSHTHAKFQNQIDQYINDDLYQYIYIIQYITTMIQLMIINIINNVIDDKFPDISEFKNIINILSKIINIKMISIPVSITLYLTQLLPLINQLNKSFNEISQ